MAQTFLSQTQAVSIALVNPAATRRQNRGKNSRQTYKIRELGQPYRWDGSRERAVRVMQGKRWCPRIDFSGSYFNSTSGDKVFWWQNLILSVCHLKDVSHKILAVETLLTSAIRAIRYCDPCFTDVQIESHRSWLLQDLTASYWQVLLLNSSSMPIKLSFWAQSYLWKKLETRQCLKFYLLVIPNPECGPCSATTRHCWSVGGNDQTSPVCTRDDLH